MLRGTSITFCRPIFVHCTLKENGYKMLYYISFTTIDKSAVWGSSFSIEK